MCEIESTINCNNSSSKPIETELKTGERISSFCFGDENKLNCNSKHDKTVTLRKSDNSNSPCPCHCHCHCNSLSDESKINSSIQKFNENDAKNNNDKDKDNQTEGFETLVSNFTDSIINLHLIS